MTPKSAEKAIVAGSFDPVTNGHIYLVKRAAAKYAEVRVVIFVNAEKTYNFSLEERLEMLRAACARFENVTVDADGGMQYLYAQKHGITVALRGYRNKEDLAYEKTIADFNAAALPGYRTELLRCPRALRGVSSTEVRRILREGGDVSALVPKEILPLIERYYKAGQQTGGPVGRSADDPLPTAQK